jgi:tetratricopeptide (TPR) repeat protein
MVKESILLAKRPTLPESDFGLPFTDGDDSLLALLPEPAVSSYPALAAAGLAARAEQLLIALSVYREPADRNAVLFQFGTHDWAAARAPDRQGPTPPYQSPADLEALLAACVAADVLTVPRAGEAGASELSGSSANAWFVDRWLAGELHSQLRASGKEADLAAAHRRAATYWQWRATAWPQDRRADIHDLLEARHHLFSAGDAAGASELTHVVCAQLHAWGDLGRETDLIQSTLRRLPNPSPGRARWLHELGAIASVRGDHQDAERRYGDSAAMFAALGDDSGVARAEHSLGVLAQAQGEYRRAERHYRKAAAAQQRADEAPGTSKAVEAEPSLAGTSADVGTEAAPSGHPVHVIEPAPAITAMAAQVTAGSAEAADHGVHHPGEAAAVARQEGQRRGQAAAVAGQETSARGHAAATEGRRPRSRKGRRHAPGIAIVALGLLALAGTGIAELAGPSQGNAAGPAGSRNAPAAIYRTEAATWVAQQVSRTATIACDPAMCAALQQRGVPTGNLLLLGPGGAADPLASDIIMSTAAVRSEFGSRLAQVYAPLAVASFGAGSTRIEVRAIAPDGAAAFRAQAAADLGARRRVGAELLRNSELTTAGAARQQLAAGNVDTRLLAILATVADLSRIRIIGFGDAGPGASAGVPMRSVTIGPAQPGTAWRSWSASVVAFLAAQQQPYRPAEVSQVRLADGSAAVRIEYATPGPLGLLSASGPAIAEHAHPLK